MMAEIETVIMAFEPEGIRIALTDILPVKRLAVSTKTARKYKQIAASVREIGLIEPLVVTRQNELNQFVATGQLVDSAISTQLIENIFFKNSPLHDGAMIITNNRIKAAGTIMPVTKQKFRASIGLRHRAAVGVTEVSDAIALIVSEENGKISYSIKGEALFLPHR